MEAMRLRIQGNAIWEDLVSHTVYIDGSPVHTTDTQKSAWRSYCEALAWVRSKHPELSAEVVELCAAPF